VGIHCADHVTPSLYQLKLALISPTGSGRSVGIVHLRTKITEFSLVTDKKVLGDDGLDGDPGDRSSQKRFPSKLTTADP
jgi:hypothetical protein